MSKLQESLREFFGLPNWENRSGPWKDINQALAKLKAAYDEHVQDTRLQDALNRTRLLTLEDMKHKTIFELLASGSEELGELSRELKIAHHTYGNTYKTPDEGPKPEAVDLTICALALFYAEGGTDQELIDTLHKKLSKWETTGQMVEPKFPVPKGA